MADICHPALPSHLSPAPVTHHDGQDLFLEIFIDLEMILPTELKPWHSANREELLPPSASLRLTVWNRILKGEEFSIEVKTRDPNWVYNSLLIDVLSVSSLQQIDKCPQTILLTFLTIWEMTKLPN